MPNKLTNEKSFLISGTIQKIMLQMTWKDQHKDDPICIGILFTEEQNNPKHKRYIMSLNENNISDFKSISQQLSLTYEELMEIVDKLLYTKTKLLDFKDKLISDIFYLSNPIEEIKNSNKSPFTLMEKHYHAFVNKKETEQKNTKSKKITSPKM